MITRISDVKLILGNIPEDTMVGNEISILCKKFWRGLREDDRFESYIWELRDSLDCADGH